MPKQPKPKAGDEVRVERSGRVYIGRVLGTAGRNGSTRYVVRSTHQELVHATRDEICAVRRETDEIVRRSVLRDAVAMGGRLPLAWRRELGLT